jgi:hypothetical protein
MGYLITLGLMIGIPLGLLLRRVRNASMGTRSVLYGAHCFLWHWFFVAKAWHALYGWKPVIDRYVGYVSLKDPRLWLAFFLHDIGYIGKEKMDDPSGERHPYTGAAILRSVFGPGWYYFVLYHSRYLAKASGAQPSLLCLADKYSFVLTPRILYLPFVRATGEIREYMIMDLTRRQAGENRREISYEHEARWRQREELWFTDLKKYMNDWVQQHRDGSDDTWTAAQSRTPITDSGVTL